MIDYNELLYQKMKAEYDSFIDELKRMTPEQIIEHAYEKVIKEDILCECEFDLFEPQEAKALYLEKHPLDRIYNDWLHNDYSYMEQIRDTISDAAKDAVKEMKDKSKESR